MYKASLVFKNFVIVLVTICLCNAILFAIGSDNFVWRFDNQETFVDLPPDNEVFGFAALQGGFKIENSSTSAIFNSFFPVSGIVEFNFRTMTLSRDLIFSEVTAYKSLGLILGNNHVMELSAGISKILPAGESLSDDLRFDNLHVILNADYELEAGLELHISGTSSITGRGNRLTFNENSSIVIDRNASLLFRDIFVDNVSDSRIRCADNTGIISLENTQWTLDDNYTFTSGKLVVREHDFRVVGQGFSFGYQTDQQSIIEENAKLILDPGVIFDYAPSTGDTDLISLTGSTSELVLNGATLRSNSPGVSLTKGKLRIQGKSFIESDGTTEFGDGITAANNLDICFSKAATLEVLSGRVEDNNV